MKGNKPLSVLHVLQPDVAGVPNVVGDILESQLEMGWHVTIAGPTGTDIENRTARLGGTFVSWNARRSPGRGLVTEALALRRIVHRIDPDVVHLHSAKAGLVGRAVIRGAYLTVFQPHAWSFLAAEGPMRIGAMAWERFATRWTDVLVCVSEDERDTGAAHGITAVTEIVPNGVDVAKWPAASDKDRHDARRRLGIGPEDSLVVCVGRLCEQKGQDLLLETWPSVRDRCPSGILALVGDGSEEQAIRSRRPSGVLLPGWSDDIDSWIAASDVVAIPSRWEAGLPLVAMEAMARCRSVVAADVEGMRDGLNPGAGAVVPVEDAPRLGEAIASRLASPSLAADEGRAGREIVESRFDLSRTSLQLAKVYRQAIDQRSSEDAPS